MHPWSGRDSASRMHCPAARASRGPVSPDCFRAESRGDAYFSPSRLILAPSGEHRLFVHEAQRIAKRVSQVERPLAPWSLRDTTHRQVAITHGIDQPAGVFRPAERILEITHREVHVLEVWPRLSLVAI